MANIRVRIWLMSVIFGLALVTGCGKDSGTDSDSDSSTSTVESSSVTLRVPADKAVLLARTNRIDKSRKQISATGLKVLVIPNFPHDNN